jgi:hypothetical protein
VLFKAYDVTTTCCSTGCVSSSTGFVYIWSLSFAYASC